MLNSDRTRDISEKKSTAKKVQKTPSGFRKIPDLKGTFINKKFLLNIYC